MNRERDVRKRMNKKLRQNIEQAILSARKEGKLNISKLTEMIGCEIGQIYAVLRYIEENDRIREWAYWALWNMPELSDKEISKMIACGDVMTVSQLRKEIGENNKNDIQNPRMIEALDSIDIQKIVGSIRYMIEMLRSSTEEDEELKKIISVFAKELIQTIRWFEEYIFSMKNSYRDGTSIGGYKILQYERSERCPNCGCSLMPELIQQAKKDYEKIDLKMRVEIEKALRANSLSMYHYTNPPYLNPKKNDKRKAMSLMSQIVSELNCPIWEVLTVNMYLHSIGECTGEKKA